MTVGFPVAGLYPFIAPTEVMIDVSGILTITQGCHIVASNSGASDTLGQVVIDTNLDDELGSDIAWVLLFAKTGHTITVTDSTAPDAVYSFFGSDLTMTANEGVLLVRNPGSGQGWTGFGTPAGTPVTETGTQTLANKTFTAPTITSPTIKWGNVNFASGTISSKTGIAYLTGGSAITYTLPDPTNVNDDGKELTIYSKTAFAHKIDYSGGAGFDGGGGSLDFANFGGAVGDNIVLFADAGVWRVKSTRNVTIAGS